MADLNAIEAADRKRDRRLRRRLLVVLHGARIGPLAGLHGRRIVDLVGDAALPGQGFTGDDHALGLLRDLVAKGYATETDLRKRKGQPFGIDYLFFAATGKGSDLIEERVDADPAVEDERNLEE